ncbi:MAG: hypothetical protein GXP54_10405, partial [Deltaproteobacteria bacterium]|nr:hypothetical protein [Deltaproteobacteria bacterium]
MMRMPTWIVACMAGSCVTWLVPGCTDPAGSDWVNVALPAGSACVAGSDCVSGICFPENDGIKSTGWTDGMCVEPCVQGKCPEGLACSVLGGSPWCLPTCGETAPCRDGYVCNTGVDACLPDCRLGWDCGEGFACSDTGICEFDWPT